MEMVSDKIKWNIAHERKWQQIQSAWKSERKQSSKHEQECDEIDQQSEGVTWAFVNNKLRIVDENCDFHEGNQEEVNRITFKEEIKQVVGNNEATKLIEA